MPTRARIGMRVGVMLGRTAKETKADIERLVAEAARDERLRGAQVKLEFKGFMADPCAFDMESEICRLARRSSRYHITCARAHSSRSPSHPH